MFGALVFATVAYAATPAAVPSLACGATVQVSATATVFKPAGTFAAHATITVLVIKARITDPSGVVIVINGFDWTRWVRVGSVHIRDAINDQPNSAALVIEQGTNLALNQPVSIYLAETPLRYQFSGSIQSLEVTYEADDPQRPIWRVAAIDDAFRAQAQLPIYSATNVSATTIAQQLVSQFAPGFTSTHVQGGLPAITVNFDGSEGFGGALAQIDKLIGGYHYWEAGDLHLFQSESGEQPDPIDAAHPPLNDPAISRISDLSQLRTRVCGKGHGENTLADVPAGESIIPIANAIMFTPTGGKAISQTQRLAYTGVQLGGAGSLVGPGVGPAAPPVATAQLGGAIPVGPVYYGVTFRTASGESRVSPATGVMTGSLGNAGAAPAPTAVSFPAQELAYGAFLYAHTFLISGGETAPSATASVNTGQISNPSIAPTVIPVAGSNPWVRESTQFLIAHAWEASGVTTAIGPWTVIQVNTGDPQRWQASGSVPNDPRIKSVHVYVSGGSPGGSGWFTLGSAGVTANGTFSVQGFLGVGAGSSAPTNNANFTRVNVTSIAIGPAGTTARRLYRTVVGGGGPLKLVTTISDNTTTSYLDATPDASLGANAPTVGSALQQVALTAIPVGITGVIARVLYRSGASNPNPGALRVLATINDNTTTTYTDAATDAGLGGGPPVSDTSGLQQPAGQVLAGSTTLIAAGVGWASPAGGWAVIGNGTQTIRYTGLSGSALSGIPVSGPGAILSTIAYNTSITAAPALTGVSGLTLALIKGAPINIWVQRDDVAAQQAMAASEGGSPRMGIYEFLVTDERRGEPSLAALCDAHLTLYSRPLVTVRYACHDVKTKSGRTVLIDLASPSIHESLVIQSVEITKIHQFANLPPLYTVTAGNARFTLEDVLRRLTSTLDGLY